MSGGLEPFFGKVCGIFVVEMETGLESAWKYLKLNFEVTLLSIEAGSD